MSYHKWTEKHDELAYDLLARGFSVNELGAILDIHPNTIYRKVVPVKMLRTHHHQDLIDARADALREIGVDPDEAKEVIANYFKT